MYDLVLICSTIPNRQDLLDKSIQTWTQSIEKSGLNACIRIYSEKYNPTSETIKELQSKFDIKTFQAKSLSGSHIKGYNHWYKRTNAKVYMLRIQKFYSLRIQFAQLMMRQHNIMLLLPLKFIG